MVVEVLELVDDQPTNKSLRFLKYFKYRRTPRVEKWLRKNFKLRFKYFHKEMTPSVLHDKRSHCMTA